MDGREPVDDACALRYDPTGIGGRRARVRVTVEHDPLIRASAVARSYGRHQALAPTDLEVLGGESLALIGPNGAGKSTLLSLLAGAIAPSQGSVSLPDPAPRVGWVPQQPALYGRLTARENLQLFARLEGASEPEARAERLQATVEIPDDGKPAGRLSGGNQQRLNLAIALLADPDVLLLDEPTAALDPRQRRRFWEIAHSVRDTGGGVVFVTQNLDELARHADRVAVLRDGHMVFTGDLSEYELSSEARIFA